jgi:DNA-binding NarL/FixJ family response regulator
VTTSGTPARSTARPGARRPPEPKIRVEVTGPDTLTTEVVTAFLREHTALLPAPAGKPDVVLVVDDHFRPASLCAVEEAAHHDVPVLLFTAGIPADAVLLLISHGAVAVLDRADTGIPELADAVIAAAHGHGVLSGPHLGALVTQVRRLRRTVLEPLGYTCAGLSEREVDILRLLAEGAGTKEIAKTLAFSESTIKKNIAEIITRFNLRNRAEAVAFAIRAGALK